MNIEQIIPEVRAAARGLSYHYRVSADDLEQEALLAILRGRKSLRGSMQDARDKEFSQSRCRGKIISLKKRRGRRSWAGRGSIERSHEGAVIARIDVARILSTLSECQRQAVILKYLMGLDRVEASRLLGISIAAWQNRADLGLKNLRKRFK